jgi:hypothetical protein
VALRNVLYQDGPFSEAEFLFMDNHCLGVCMTRHFYCGEGNFRQAPRGRECSCDFYIQ